MADQYRQLIEHYREAQALQAESHQILKVGQHSATALNVENKRALMSCVGRGTRQGDHLYEFGLSDAGRTIDEHDVRGTVLMRQRSEEFVELINI